MSHDPVTSTDRLRKALQDDHDGSWTAGFAAKLESLATVAEAALDTLRTDELKFRCSALASAARAGVGLLLTLREGLAPDTPHARLPPADAGLLAQTTETSLLYELGWLAIEASHEDAGLAIVEAVGTLLHGRLGGAMFRVESLLVIGRPIEAAQVLETCLARQADGDGLAAATLASLWAQRAAGRGRCPSLLANDADDAVQPARM